MSASYGSSTAPLTNLRVKEIGDIGVTDLYTYKWAARHPLTYVQGESPGGALSNLFEDAAPIVALQHGNSRCRYIPLKALLEVDRELGSGD
jgi:hypothetical protein